jgi:hypothetical protein
MESPLLQVQKKPQLSFFDKLKGFIMKYSTEFIEAFVALLVVQFIINNKFEPLKLIKPVLIIASITTILETYNPAYKTTVKNSVVISGVSQIVKTI